MKPATVALLILMNMMCTISYFDHASFLGTKAAQETTILANSYGSNEETGSMKGHKSWKEAGGDKPPMVS